MVRKMQDFALAGRCGSFTASGEAGGSSPRSKAFSATVPSVAPRPNRNSRRSVDIDELARVQQHQTQVGERPRFPADVPRLQIGDEVFEQVEPLAPADLGACLLLDERALDFPGRWRGGGRVPAVVLGLRNDVSEAADALRLARRP